MVLKSDVKRLDINFIYSENAFWEFWRQYNRLFSKQTEIVENALGFLRRKPRRQISTSITYHTTTKPFFSRNTLNRTSLLLHLFRHGNYFLKQVYYKIYWYIWYVIFLCKWTLLHTNMYKTTWVLYQLKR